MPTPFTHLVAANDLLNDPALPAELRQTLRDEAGAFLLGNVAADARVSSGLRREDTHFYAFDQPITERPWRTMLQAHPCLARPRSAGQRAFVAGYVAHLVMDEVWTLNIVRPYFAAATWADARKRFLMLNVLMVTLDRRDYPRVPAWMRPALAGATPRDWTPFIGDGELAAWRDLVARQLPPGASETLAIIGERVQLSPAELEAILESPGRMQRDLWRHIDPEIVAQTETLMIEQARAELAVYCAECEVEPGR